MKRIFVIDWSLLPALAGVLATGIGLHVTGEGPHGIWHNWAGAHMVFALLFLIVVGLHVQSHWGWYRSWFRSGPGKKSRVTALLTVLWLVVAVTGIILLPVEGEGSGLGRWHFILGIIASILAVGHLLKRLPVLRKSLKHKKVRRPESAHLFMFSIVLFTCPGMP